MRRVLVTGASGFIGRNLVSALVRHGVSVVGVDTEPPPPATSRAADFLRMDFADEQVIEMVRARRFGAVLHHGAISSTMEERWDRLHDVNVARPIRLAEACAASGTSFIYASSSSVYGRIGRRVAVREEGVIDRSLCSGPLNLYATSKLRFDTHLMEQAAENLHWVGLRYTNVFGPGEQQKGSMASILSQLLRTAAAERTVTLFADTLEASRDYVPVEWVTRALIQILDTGVPSGIYNVGSGHAISFATVLRWCVEFGGERGVPVHLVPNPISDRYQYWTCADTTKLHGVVSLPPVAVADVRAAAYHLYCHGR